MMGRCLGMLAILALLVCAASPGFALVFEGKSGYRHWTVNADWTWDGSELCWTLTNATPTYDPENATKQWFHQNTSIGGFVFGFENLTATLPTPTGGAVATQVIEYWDGDNWLPWTYPGPNQDIGDEWGYRYFSAAWDAMPAETHAIAGLNYDWFAGYKWGGPTIQDGNIDGADFMIAGPHDGGTGAFGNDIPVIFSQAKFCWPLTSDPGALTFAAVNMGTDWAPSTVPEPASCALLAFAIGGIGVALKKRRTS